jgi:toxin ParE1/3/4
VAERNETAADQLVDRLLERSRLLASFPEAGQARPEIRPDFRYLPVESYLVFYRLIRGGIEVVRYIHGARLLPEAL